MRLRCLAAATVLSVLSVLSVIAGCADLMPPPPDAPRPRDGAVDLSGWDFDARGPLVLAGTWELVWHAGPQDADVVTRAADARVMVPGNWDDAGFPAEGFGVFRLHVALPDVPLGVMKTHADSAWALWVDDGSTRVPIANGGVLGTDRASEHPEGRAALAPLPRARALTLLEGVSNFHYRHGGEGAATAIGPPRQLEQWRDAARARDFFLAGFIVVVGLYHLALFGLRRTERAPLYFGLFCILLALRSVERGRHFEDLLPGLDLWSTTKRVEFACFYLSVPLFLLYVDALIAGGVQRHARRAALAVYLGMTTVVLVMPPRIFGWTAELSQVATISCLVWSMTELVRAWRRTRETTFLIVLGGFALLGTTVVLEVLSTRNLIGLPIVTSLGLAAFVSAQALVIAVSHARARRTSEQLADELLRMSKLKDEFLASTSHELRTPLNSIINIPRAILEAMPEKNVGTCGACGEAFEAEDDDEQGASVAPCPACGAIAITIERRRFPPDDVDALAQQLAGVIGSGTGLLHVVDAIMDWSKLASGQLTLTLEDAALRSVVSRARAAVAPRAAAAGVDVRVQMPDDLVARADGARLTQVLAILLENAVTFSPAGSAVDVDVRAASDDFIVRVSDHGPGVAPDQLRAIFEPFRQALGESRRGHTRPHGGAGLGLAIARGLMALHGGSLDVESTPGAGAVFTARWPRARTAR